MLETGSQAGRTDEGRGEYRSGICSCGRFDADVIELSLRMIDDLVVEAQDQAGYASAEIAIGFSHEYS